MCDLYSGKYGNCTRAAVITPHLTCRHAIHILVIIGVVVVAVIVVGFCQSAEINFHSLAL